MLPRHLSCLDLPLWLSLSFPYLFLAGHLHISAALKSLQSKRLDGAGEGVTALLQYCHVSRRSRSDCTCPSREPGQLSLSGASLRVKALRFKNRSLFKLWSVTFLSEDLSTQILLKKAETPLTLIHIGKWELSEKYIFFVHLINCFVLENLRRLFVCGPIIGLSYLYNLRIITFFFLKWNYWPFYFYRK